MTLGRLSPNEPVVRWNWLADHLDVLVQGLLQHLWLTAVAVGVGFVLSLGLSVLALRFHVTWGPINAATGVLYAVPSLALFVLLTPITGLTTLTAEIALVSYTLQILTRSIVAGVNGVPPAVLDAARGTGHSRRQLLWWVELPLALPVIVSGLRIATVTTVGLVPIAGLLGSDQGGLGQLIFDGLNRVFPTPLLAGALLTVALAVGLDLALLRLERALTPWTREQPPPGGPVDMSFLQDVLVWFNDPLNWRGTDGVPNRVLQHLRLCAGALALAALIALPPAAWLGHRRRGGAVAVNIANVGRAVPSIAVLVIGVIWLGGDYTPALLTLTLLALPPIFTLTYTAVRDVDPSVVDAARGMGVGGVQLLRGIELPVAWPLILAGLRLSAAAVIATATIAALPGGGGLGRYIVHGFAIRDFAEVFAGTLLVVGLVILSEGVFAALGRWTVSPGLRSRVRRAR